MLAAQATQWLAGTMLAAEITIITTASPFAALLMARPEAATGEMTRLVVSVAIASADATKKKPTWPVSVRLGEAASATMAARTSAEKVISPSAALHRITLQ